MKIDEGNDKDKIMDCTSTIPPLIFQYFSSYLLNTPMPRFRDSLQTFECMWQEALTGWIKVEKYPERLKQCELLNDEILELYDRAKIKEKEREGETDHKTQAFGYQVNLSTRLAREIYWRLRFRRKDLLHTYEFRCHSSLYKAKGKQKR